MDTLREAGIPFGCITVLTRRNIDFVSNIYSFYERLGIDFRVLPLFPGETAAQHEGYEITAEETLRAYKQIVDLMFQRETMIRVEPLVTHIRAALLFLARRSSPNIYRREEWERYFIIDTDGAAYCIRASTIRSNATGMSLIPPLRTFSPQMGEGVPSPRPRIAFARNARSASILAVATANRSQSVSVSSKTCIGTEGGSASSRKA